MPETDRAAEIAALREVHATDRRAHIETSVNLILRHADDTFIAVSGGEVEHMTLAQVAGGFVESFRGATYFEGDDLEPPIIRVSDDASMAWIIVRVRARKTQPDDSDEPHERIFVYQLARREDPWLEPWGGNAARRQALPTTGHQTTRCAIRTPYRRACGKVRVWRWLRATTGPCTTLLAR